MLTNDSLPPSGRLFIFCCRLYFLLCPDRVTHTLKHHYHYYNYDYDMITMIDDLSMRAVRYLDGA